MNIVIENSYYLWNTFFTLEVLPLISRRTQNFMIHDQKEHDLEQIFIYNTLLAESLRSLSRLI